MIERGNPEVRTHRPVAWIAPTRFNRPSHRDNNNDGAKGRAIRMSGRDGVALRNELRTGDSRVDAGLGAAWAVVLLVGLAYYAGAKVGFAFNSAVGPLSLLWPPNALLLGALLLLPRRRWWLALVGTFLAHMPVQLLEGIPPPMALAWFASNVGEALIGAVLLTRHDGSATRFDSGRAVLAFLAATSVAVVLASFADAALVTLIGWKDTGFWTLWRSRLPSNILAILIFVPACLALRQVPSLRREPPRPMQVFEVAAFQVTLLAVSLVAFDTHLLSPAASPWPGFVYLPLPFLIWAALRFGPLLSGISFSIVAFVVLWGVQHGRGPFFDTAAAGDAQPTQWYLISLAVPMLLLAGLMQERRAGERRLRANQSLSEAAFDSAVEAIALVRRGDGQVIQANERWRELFPTLPESLVELLDSRQDVRDRELTLVNVPDAPRRVQVSIRSVERGGGQWAVCAVHDVTALRRAERERHEHRLQLMHLNRVGLVSGLAGALAHELNQPLTTILSNAQAGMYLLDRQPPDLAELRTILAEIAAADKRADELIQHLRLMMKNTDEHFERLDPNTLVEQVAQLAERSLAMHNVELRMRLATGLPAVRGDRVQLQQLLLNLVSNACDAMAEKHGPRVVSITTLASRSGGTQVLVDDTGAGIPPDRREAIFKPFYTSRPGGLGLGLSICRLIVDAHGGSLAVADREGEGARLRLELPRAPGP